MAQITPKFLTKELARIAVAAAIQAVFGQQAIRKELKRENFHIVILVPSMEDGRPTDYADYPNYPITPQVLYEFSQGEKASWEAKYDDIAKCKALQLWGDRNFGGTGIVPHLLFAGDAPFWGGVKREGIVVTCSGVQSRFDRMISGIACDILIALADNAFQKSGEGGDFLK